MRTFTTTATAARIKEIVANKEAGIVAQHGCTETSTILEMMAGLEGLNEVAQHTKHPLNGNTWLHVFENGDNMVHVTIMETQVPGKFTEYLVTSVSPDLMDYTEGNY